jgi:hypothetical protein
MVRGSRSALPPSGEAPSAKLAKLLRSGKRLPHRLAHGARVALDILFWIATWQLRAGLRRRRHARLIRRSGLFDRAHYLAQCPGDPDARKDPFTHYLTRGAALGLDPNPLFDTAAYAARNPSAAGTNPLVHLILTRGGARAAASGAAPSRSLPGANGANGADALALPPFRPPPPEGVEREILVVQGRGAMWGEDPGAARMLAALEVLRELECSVTFISPSGGLSAALAQLVDGGHRYRWVLLSGAEESFRLLAPLRAYAPQATVIYDTAGLRSLQRMERVVVACSDLVLATSTRDRELLLREVPAARVEVVPSALTRSRLEALLASPAAPSARPALTIVETGSAA